MAATMLSVNLLAGSGNIYTTTSPQIVSGKENDHPIVYQIVKIDNTPVVKSECSEETKNDKACVQELIYKYADQYEIDRELALNVALCESELKTTAIGDGGKARGVYQFHKPTFDLLSKKMGEKMDYKNTEDNIKLAMWAFSTDRGFHWSCYRKITANSPEFAFK